MLHGGVSLLVDLPKSCYLWRTRMIIASSGQLIFLHHIVLYTDVGFSTGSAHWQLHIERDGGGGWSGFLL